MDLTLSRSRKKIIIFFIILFSSSFYHHVLTLFPKFLFSQLDNKKYICMFCVLILIVFFQFLRLLPYQLLFF